MKKFSRVLIGGALVVCGCGFFLYPNFREWNTQREVNQIIESFDKKYSESINANDSSDTVVETSDKNDYKESKNQHAATLTATPAEAQKSTGEVLLFSYVKRCKNTPGNVTTATTYGEGERQFTETNARYLKHMTIG